MQFLHLSFSPLPFPLRVLFFCDIFLSNSSSAKWIHKSGRKTSKQSIVKVKCWWSILFLSLCYGAMRSHLHSALYLITSFHTVLFSISKRNPPFRWRSTKTFIIKIGSLLWTCRDLMLVCLSLGSRVRSNLCEDTGASRSFSLLVTLFFIVATTMVSGHRGRQRACWCQDQGPRPCHWITNTLSLRWGGERDCRKHYRKLSRVRLRCSWEHRYDNGTDPVSLWLITRTYPSKHVTIWCGYFARNTQQGHANVLYECTLCRQNVFT